MSELFYNCREIEFSVVNKITLIVTHWTNLPG